MTQTASLPQTAYCYHCGRHHPVEEMRQIATKAGRKWCFHAHMMVRLISNVVPRLLTAFLVTTMMAGAAFAEDPAPSGSWYDRSVQQLGTIWKEGQYELYVPLHIYHMRFAYTKAKIDSFNETPWGLGIGKGVYDEEGDWHGVYVMEFQDSHYKPEWFAGYGYKTFWPIRDELKFGLGYVAFVTARADIGHYTPVPLALPMVSLEYQKYSFDTVYVPGGRGYGNILIFWGKARF